MAVVPIFIQFFGVDVELEINVIILSFCSLYSGVDLRWRLTGVVFLVRPGSALLYGLTGTIFLSFCVFAIYIAPLFLFSTEKTLFQMSGIYFVQYRYFVHLNRDSAHLLILTRPGTGQGFYELPKHPLYSVHRTTASARAFARQFLPLYPLFFFI